VQSSIVKSLARECGFELAGTTAALPTSDRDSYQRWVSDGFAGEMMYLTDRRAIVRNDPRNLLPSARSIVSVGKLYNGPKPYSTKFHESELAWISRYAWGEDYHDVLRRGLQHLADRLLQVEPLEYKICVDTAPLLARSYARQAGLGWIGKNTCLINQQMGSWFFLGELLVSLELEPDAPPPDRCGSCTRCIDACPTAALVPDGEGYALDSRLCISYFTIELRGPTPPEQRAEIGNHVFGCDICQDVCPWNTHSPSTTAFEARHFAPPLEKLAQLSAEEFHEMFRGSPILRARYSGFLRNVAVAMGNARSERFREPLQKLAESTEPLVAEHARWALDQLN
jgi:epoxyqueuosine reductase